MRENIYNVSDKGLTPRIYKESQLNNKTTNGQILKIGKNI